MYALGEHQYLVMGPPDADTGRILQNAATVGDEGGL